MARFKFLHNQDSPTIDNATFDSTSNDVSLVVGKKLVMLFTDFVKNKYFHHKSDTSVDVTEFKYYFLSCSGEFPFTPANTTAYVFTNDGDYDYCNDITSFDLGKCLKVKINGVERYIATMNSSGNCTLTLKKTNSSGNTLNSVNVNGVPQNISGNTITLNGSSLSSDVLTIVSSYGSTPAQPTYTYNIACTDVSPLQASATSTNMSVTIKANGEHTSVTGYTIKTYSGSTLLGTTQLSGTSPKNVLVTIAANTSTSSRTITAKLYNTSNVEVGSTSITQSGATPSQPTYTYSLTCTDASPLQASATSTNVLVTVKADGEHTSIDGCTIKMYSGSTLLGGAQLSGIGTSPKTISVPIGANTSTSSRTITVKLYNTSNVEVASSQITQSGATPAQPTYTYNIACTDASPLQASATLANMSVTIKADGEHTSVNGYTIKTYSGSTLLGTTQLSGTSPKTVSATIAANTSTSSRTITAKLYNTNNDEVSSTSITQSGATPVVDYTYRLEKVSPTGNTISMDGETVSLKVNAFDDNGIVNDATTQYSGLTIKTMIGTKVVDTYAVTPTGTYSYTVPSYNELIDHRMVTFTLYKDDGTQLSKITYYQDGRRPIVSVVSKTHNTIVVNLSDSDITSMERGLLVRKTSSSFCRIPIPDGTSQFTITNSVMSSISGETLQQLEPSTTYKLSYNIKMSNDPDLGIRHSSVINVTTDAAPPTVEMPTLSVSVGQYNISISRSGGNLDSFEIAHSGYRVQQISSTNVINFQDTGNPSTFSTVSLLQPNTEYAVTYWVQIDGTEYETESVTFTTLPSVQPTYTYAISTPNNSIAYTATSISMTATRINGSQQTPCAGYYVTLNGGQAMQLDSNGAYQFTIPQNTSTTQITHTIKLYQTNDTTATPLATKSVTQSAAPAPTTPYYWVTRSGVLTQDDAISRCDSTKEVAVNTTITDCKNNIYFFVPASKDSTLWVVNAAFESNVFINNTVTPNIISDIVDAPVGVTVNGIAYKMYHFSTNGSIYTFKIKS